MLMGSLEAFKHRDADRARAICNEDDEVDGLCDQVYRELLTFMLQDSRTIQWATYLTWVAHNLERIADRQPTSASVWSTWWKAGSRN
jgi:phosphate transport system protein